MMKIWCRFRINEKNLPLITELRDGTPPPTKYFGGWFCCPRKDVQRLYRTARTGPNSGVVFYGEDYIPFAFRVFTFKKYPWIDQSVLRTVSAKRYAGCRRNKPAFGWSKKRKQRHRLGF